MATLQDDYSRQVVLSETDKIEEVYQGTDRDSQRFQEDVAGSCTALDGVLEDLKKDENNGLLPLRRT